MWMDDKAARQILEPNKMTVQNGMKRITEWMEWTEWMDGWMDGRTDGMDGMDGWMDGWTDGRMDGPQMQIICRVGIKWTKYAFSFYFLFISKKRKRIMQPNVLIGPGTKTYVPNLSSQLAFMSIGSLVPFYFFYFLNSF
jgi:hypothetical protein